MGKPGRIPTKSTTTEPFTRSISDENAAHRPGEIASAADDAARQRIPVPVLAGRIDESDLRIRREDGLVFAGVGGIVIKVRLRTGAAWPACGTSWTAQPDAASRSSAVRSQDRIRRLELSACRCLLVTRRMVPATHCSARPTAPGSPRDGGSRRSGLAWRRGSARRCRSSVATSAAGTARGLACSSRPAHLGRLMSW